MTIDGNEKRVRRFSSQKWSLKSHNMFHFLLGIKDREPKLDFYLFNAIFIYWRAL